MVARAKARYEIVAEDKTRGAFESVRASVGGLRASFKLLAGAAGIGLVVKGIKDIVLAASEANNRLADLAVRLSTDARTLSELRYAASATGVSFEQMITSLQRLSRRTAEAVEGNQQLRDTFEGLGINVDKFAKLPLRERVRVFADAIKDVKDGNERLRVIVKLLDSEGAGMLQTFKDGAKGLDEFAAQAAAAGTVVTKEMENAAKDTKKSLDLLGQELEGVGQDLTKVFGGAIDYVADRLRGLIRLNRLTAKSLAELAGRAGNAALDALSGGNYTEATRELEEVAVKAEKVKQTFIDLSQTRIAGSYSRTPLKIASDEASSLLQKMQSVLDAQDALRRQRSEGQVIDLRFRNAVLPGTSPSRDPNTELLRQMIRAFQDDTQRRELAKALTDLKDVLARNSGSQVAVIG